MSVINSKIVKQIEYYFGDLNIAKDKYLKSLISSAIDGYVSYEEMLKFPRLKSISDDSEVIRLAIQHSESKLVEANEYGIRRNLELEIPSELQSVTDMHLDKSLYVKGFNPDVTIDEIIEYCESNGGPTLNIHMRRIPKSKAFKGSVFVIFKEKEDAEKFLNNEEASNFMGNDMKRIFQAEYMASKKTEYDDKQKEKEIRLKSVSANREALLDTKMTKGALIELSGFDAPIKNETSTEGTDIVSGDFTDNRDFRTATKNLKTFLSNLLTDVAPVSWVEHFPSTGKVIVRFGKENSAEEALKALLKSDNGLFKYQNYDLSVVVLSGEAEKDYWRNILNEQSKKSRVTTKRFGGRGGRTGGPDRKRMRR